VPPHVQTVAVLLWEVQKVFINSIQH